MKSTYSQVKLGIILFLICFLFLIMHRAHASEDCDEGCATALMDEAILSQHIYSNSFNETVAGYHPLSGYGHDSPDGFRGQAYVNHSKQKIVLAFAGTHFGSYDFIDDAYANTEQYFREVLPNQYLHGIILANRVIELKQSDNYKTYTFTLTGHSLGGGIGTVANEYFEYDKATVFNPSTIWPNSYETVELADDIAPGANLTSVISAGGGYKDLVSHIGSQALGHIVYLDIESVIGEPVETESVFLPTRPIFPISVFAASHAISGLSVIENAIIEAKYVYQLHRISNIITALELIITQADQELPCIRRLSAFSGVVSGRVSSGCASRFYEDSYATQYEFSLRKPSGIVINLLSNSGDVSRSTTTLAKHNGEFIRRANGVNRNWNHNLLSKVLPKGDYIFEVTSRDDFSEFDYQANLSHFVLDTCTKALEPNHRVWVEGELTTRSCRSKARYKSKYRADYYAIPSKSIGRTLKIKIRAVKDNFHPTLHLYRSQDDIGNRNKAVAVAANPREYHLSLEIVEEASFYFLEVSSYTWGKKGEYKIQARHL